MWSEAEYLTTAVGGKRPFFVQAAAGARNLSISVTDFARLWTESLTPGEFANRLKVRRFFLTVSGVITFL